jgi:hypothetical protein
MTDRELEEYKALRATIRQRGTARAWVFVSGLAAWAALTLASTLAALPLIAVIPLLLLAATFEVVFALHVAVERIGRYIEVFHEDRWEQTAMALGAPLAGTGTDPLFTVFFVLAAIFNLIPVMLSEPVRVELVVIGGLHLFFIVRLGVARRAAGRQREADRTRFRQIKDDHQRGTP